jgi:hypothetical protein
VSGTRKRAILEEARRELFPAMGLYTVGDHEEAVLILALAGRSEVRILDAEGRIRTVLEHRVRLLLDR